MLPIVLLFVAVTELSAGERSPAVLIISVPKQAAPASTSSALLLALSSALSEQSAYSLLTIEQPECERARRLSCWTASVHASRPSVRVILAVDILPLDRQGDRLTLTAIDVERALSVTAEDDDAREDAIFALAPRSDPAVAGDLDAWARSAVGSVLPHESLGVVRVEHAVRGLELVLDQRTLGVALEATLLIRDVRAGKRTLSHAGHTLTMDVAAGSTATATFPLPAAPGELETPAPATHAVVFWTGAAFAATGSALIFGSLVAGDRRHAHCLGAQETSDVACGAIDLPSLLPFGAAALGAGGTWLTGELVSTDTDPVWIELAIGAGVAIAAFAVTAAVDPQ